MKLKFRVITLLSVMMLLSVFAGQSFGQTSEKANVKWLTYTDPRFDFTIEYPADWYVVPRDDSDPTAMSGIVTFTSIDPTSIDVETHRHHEGHQDVYEVGEPRFVIGHYLAEFESGMSLSAWTDAYETISNGTEAYQIHERVSRIIDNKTALSVKGESSLLEYQFTNVPNGKVVWFIWTNIGDSASAEEKALYEHTVASFKLGTKSPRSLQSIYGNNFKPQPLKPRVFNSASKLPNYKLPGLASPLATISLPSPSSAWYAPIASGNNYRVNCGSNQHIDDEPHKYSRYAADIAMYQAPVKSAHTSWVDFAGWANGGWGNLVMASTDFLFSRVYTLHYAHLNSISVYPGQRLGTRSHIGASGNTGINNYHLHFHIRSSTDSVNLTGMNGFYPDSDYPDNNADCGYVER